MKTKYALAENFACIGFGCGVVWWTDSRGWLVFWSIMIGAHLTLAFFNIGWYSYEKKLRHINHLMQNELLDQVEKKFVERGWTRPEE